MSHFSILQIFIIYVIMNRQLLYDYSLFFVNTFCMLTMPFDIQQWKFPDFAPGATSSQVHDVHNLVPDCSLGEF